MVKGDILEELEYFDLKYIRARDDSGKIKRGDIFIDNRRIPHYPQIGRILSLRKGILRNFNESFIVEEKYDGYNVRVFMHEGKVLAATRGGILCPFSSEKLMPIMDVLRAFFMKYPQYVLVGEVVGQKNPYMDAPTTYKLSRDTEIFFFDVFDEYGTLLLPDKRRAILKEFALPQVPLLGIYSHGKEALENIEVIIRDLNKKRREGIVIKSRTIRGKYLKYVTPVVNLLDIAGDSLLIAELPGNFFTSRIIRYVLSSMEIGVYEEFDMEYLFYKGIKEAVKSIERYGYIFKDVSLFFESEENMREFLRIFSKISKHIKIEGIQITRESDGYVLNFRKIYLDATRKVKDFLSGKYLYD